jgi:hypothetical protein
MHDQAATLSPASLIIKRFFRKIVTQSHVRRFLFDGIDKGT